MSSDTELSGYPLRRNDHVLVLRGFDRIKIEIDNALLSTNLMISRAEDDLVHGRERKKRLLDRLETLQASSYELYWYRLLTWANTGRLV